MPPKLLYPMYDDTITIDYSRVEISGPRLLPPVRTTKTISAAKHLSQAFDVLADLVLHPMFREEDIEKEKGVILEEIKMEEDSPDYLVHEIFPATI